ncbi:MAG: glycoside hydrolase family 78 protein [Bacteroidota bacterium]
MRKLLFIITLLVVFNANAQVKLQNVLVENRSNPVGLDTKQPRFSWQLVSDKKNVMQSAYELKVLDEGKKQVWTSGKVTSDQSVFVPYAGPALTSNTKYTVQVKVWDNSSKASNVSEGWWQTALFDKSEWKAKWIMSALPEDSTSQPSPMFRKEFTPTKKVASATAYITAQGLYEAYVNGKRVGDSYLTPGWTTYNKRIQYQQYDVTSLLALGNNAVGIELGSGWYRGFIGFPQGQHNVYGKTIAALFQLTIKYTDGTSESIGSDETWKCSTGSITSSEIYHGESIDSRKDQPGWTKTGFDQSKWVAVKIKENNDVNLVATYNEPIRKHETFKVVKLITTPKGESVLDFGQNLVGWVQVKATGKAGDKISIYHAEVLDKEGNFYIENLRPAKQKNEYTLKGGAEETFEPHFTFQGFRYIKVEGYPGSIKPENFTAIALYSDMKPTGSFTSSNQLINQLQHNIQWGQRGNFLDVPTDCPQRDERLGWTGDAQAFARTASFNFNVNDFFSKWLKDLELEQINGSVPFVIPNVMGSGAAGSTGWADAATIIPWAMYTAYGDKRILENQHESMKAWVGYMERNSTNNLWNKGFHFGDWLFYRPFDDNDGRSAVTDKYLIAQCFYANSVDIVLKSATILGKQDDVAKYSALLKNVKDAFVKEYVTPNGRLVSGTQTAFVLALNFDMLPESMRKPTAERLVENIKSYDNHLTTGFLGTPYLCHVLSRYGYNDVAYSLLLQETYPSWLYPVKMGATTIWERWDGIKPDGTFQTPGMNSFNHYAYGAIGDWMYRVVAGIDTKADQPGYKGITIKPTIDGRLTSASAEYQTYYGKIRSSWKIENGKVLLDVEIPANTKATIYVPGGETVDVGSGTYSYVGSLATPN